MDEDDQRPVFYGDLRVTSDRRKGTCLFWVVPDVAPGFNVPAFYEDFVAERRAHVHSKVERNLRRIAAEQKRQYQPPPEHSSVGIP